MLISVVSTNDHIERSHGLFCKALHRVVLQTGVLREGGATVERTDSGLVRSFICLVSPASDVVPVLLASLENCLTVRTVMSLLRLQSCSSCSAVSLVDPECLDTAPHSLIAVRTEERSWRTGGGPGGHPLVLHIPRLGVVMEGVVHVDQPGYPVDIVVAAGHLQPQVRARLHLGY